MFFCNLLVILLLATWAVLGTSSDFVVPHLLDTTIHGPGSIHSKPKYVPQPLTNGKQDHHLPRKVTETTDENVPGPSDDRQTRGLLKKHFPGLFHSTAYSGSLASSNSFNLFGKYLTTAFALSYGRREPEFQDGGYRDAHVTFVKAVAQSKRPVEVLIISNLLQGAGLNQGESSQEQESPNEGGSLGSYLEDKVDEDRKKTRPTKVPAAEMPVKNHVAIKPTPSVYSSENYLPTSAISAQEDYHSSNVHPQHTPNHTEAIFNTNSLPERDSTSNTDLEPQHVLSSNSSVSFVPVKQETAPVLHKQVAKNIISLKEKNNNLVKLVSTLAQNYSLEVKEIIPFDDVPSNQKANLIQDLIKMNRQKGDMCYIIVVNGEDQTFGANDIQGVSVTRVGKGLNVYEVDQIEQLKRKLNRTESVQDRVSCVSFTLYVF